MNWKIIPQTWQRSVELLNIYEVFRKLWQTPKKSVLCQSLPYLPPVDWFHALKIDHVICYQNRHKEEDNYNELTMLPKAAISVLGSFRENQET